MGTVTTSQFVFADGGGTSPAICKGGPTTPNGANVVGHPLTTITAASPINSICIKDGANSFAQPFPQHSGLISAPFSGLVGLNSCYDVQGLGTTSVTITEQCGTAMQVSHIDYFMQGGVPPGSGFVGGEFIGIETTAVLLAGVHIASAWMIPALVAAAGFGIVISRKF